MKVALSKIHAIQQGQSSLHPSLIKLGAEELPAMKKRYWLGRLIDAALSEIKTIEKHRSELVKKYADGKDAVPPENHEAFFAEFNELLEVEIELPDFSLTLDDLPEGSRLTAIDLMSLDWIVVETAEAAPAKKKSKLKAVNG